MKGEEREGEGRGGEGKEGKEGKGGKKGGKKGGQGGDSDGKGCWDVSSIESSRYLWHVTYQGGRGEGGGKT